MSTLHQILSGSEDTWRDCSLLLQRDDEVLLVDDGARRLLAPDTLRGYRVLVLQADATARGLEDLARRSAVELVSDHEWVDLLRRHGTVLSWR